MFSSSSPFFSLPPTKNARESAKAKSGKRPSYHPAFSDVVSGVSHRAKRDASRRKNKPVQAPGNALVLPEGTMPPVLLEGMVPQVPFVHPAFGTGLVFYMLPIALIRRPNDMLSSPFGQHILDYEPPRGAFATFDGSADPYDHMLHYNQAMILNADNDHLLCKVFSASLQGSALAWFHKLSRNSKYQFNELWAGFVLQYLCLV